MFGKGVGCHEPAAGENPSGTGENPSGTGRYRPPDIGQRRAGFGHRTDMDLGTTTGGLARDQQTRNAVDSTRSVFVLMLASECHVFACVRHTEHAVRVGGGGVGAKNREAVALPVQ